jgi:6-phosphogluconate dehydrogenase
MGLYGLGVMGQNLALNVASKGFQISVANRGPERVDSCLSRAEKEGLEDKVVGFKDLKSFVESLEQPRRVMFLVKAGQAVDDCISMFADLLSPGDILIDGGNEWFENSERRAKLLEDKGIMYLAMGVSGGEYGARWGPSLMPGGPKKAYAALEPVLTKVAAQSDSGPCVTYLGAGGCGNYVKMVHNGIEYGDMQIIAEAYDLLRNNGFSNDEIGTVFEEFNGGELQSYLMEISAKILRKRDEDVIAWADGKRLEANKDFLVDKILDATGNKGTGKMTVQEAAAQGVAVPTIAAALDARFLSSCKEERLRASEVLKAPEIDPSTQDIDRKQLVEDVKNAMYCSKIISYAQGMNLIKEASTNFGWNVNLGEAARVWKEGCIIRAQFLDRIKSAYDKDPQLPSLLLDNDFAKELGDRQTSWRRAVILSMKLGVSSGAMAASLAYYDQYRRALLPANMVQAQRDFFGSHTFERLDRDRGEFFHCLWDETHAEETGKR